VLSHRTTHSQDQPAGDLAGQTRHTRSKAPGDCSARPRGVCRAADRPDRCFRHGFQHATNPSQSAPCGDQEPCANRTCRSRLRMVMGKGLRQESRQAWQIGPVVGHWPGPLSRLLSWWPEHPLVSWFYAGTLVGHLPTHQTARMPRGHVTTRPVPHRPCLVLIPPRRPCSMRQTCFPNTSTAELAVRWPVTGSRTLVANRPGCWSSPRSFVTPPVLLA